MEILNKPQNNILSLTAATEDCKSIIFMMFLSLGEESMAVA